MVLQNRCSLLKVFLKLTVLIILTTSRKMSPVKFALSKVIGSGFATSLNSVLHHECFRGIFPTFLKQSFYKTPPYGQLQKSFPRETFKELAKETLHKIP